MPVHPIAHDRQRQVEKRRGLDQPDPPPQVEVDDRRLERRLVRAVDQVEAEAERGRQAPVSSRSIARFDRVERQTRRAEDARAFPPRPIASTISTEPMPLAIAPDMLE